jgi:REP element-mobilizing transposase RayT
MARHSKIGRPPGQLPLGFSRRGGKRKGAGRKPNGSRAGTSHLKRPPVNSRFPIHVTLTVMAHVYNLRTVRCFSRILRCLVAGKERFGFRVVHYSVMGNHFHFLVEAANRKALSRGMQGLSIRMAKALNNVMGRKGRVFADRYHARILKTPAEVRAALGYVLKNRLRHSRQQNKSLPKGFVDPFSSAVFFLEGISPRGIAGKVPEWRARFARLRQGLEEVEVAVPRTWLVQKGWRRAGAIDMTANPGAG